MEANVDKELEPLKTAVVSSLESDGTLNVIRAQLRAHVFRVCDITNDNNCRHNNTKDDNKRPKDEQNLIIDHLIREYLVFNGYKQTLNIFDCETGRKSDSNTDEDIDRDLVQKRLGFRSKSQLPLFNTIIKQFLDRKTSD